MNRTKKLFFLICFALLQIAVFAHPLHVSICQINYNEQNQNLEIYINVYIDDLTTALKDVGEPEMYIGEEREISQADSIITSYLKSRFSIIVNDKETDISFVGKEMDTDAVWSYFESDKIEEPKKITVYSEIFTDIFETQNNIIQVTKDNEMLNMILNWRNTEGTIEF